MSMQFRNIQLHAAGPGTVTADEILALRRSIWQDGLVDAAEAEAILSLNATLAAPSAEWVEFFVEALSVWLVDQQDPRGYVDGPQADWLIARLPNSGTAELELLARVLEKAVAAPDHLRRFALDRVEQAVIAGTPCVTAAEARLLRRVLFSSGGDRPAGISQAEAELLFRIKDACLAADNDPEWQRLFVQGVGNFLQAIAAAPVPSRERERELERFMASPEPGLGGFLGRMARVHPNGFASAVRDVRGFGRKQPGRDWAGEAAQAHAIDSSEQVWLDDHVQADGAIDAYEQALIDFLATE